MLRMKSKIAAAPNHCFMVLIAAVYSCDPFDNTTPFEVIDPNDSMLNETSKKTIDPPKQRMQKNMRNQVGT